MSAIMRLVTLGTWPESTTRVASAPTLRTELPLTNPPVASGEMKA